MMAKIQP
ncbi:hypothetical protein YPPY66_2347, partial [Yersinia pestis PY-66]